MPSEVPATTRRISASGTSTATGALTTSRVQRRQGFTDHWQVLECTHDYNQSHYYADRSDEQLTWEGYDAFAQTAQAQAYVRSRGDAEQPFLLVLSWGPPHAPYDTAPREYVEQYRAEDIELRPNVPESHAARAREWLAGYYAHCSALDTCLGDLLDTVAREGIAEHTVLLFFSDHGDMLGSQGSAKKQQPWEESIRVPFLLRYPDVLGGSGRQAGVLIDIPDIMPTLLGLCGIAVPDTVEGLDFSGFLRGGADPSDGAALLSCPHPFGQWYPELGGREFRGLRTRRLTYVRSLAGPWLLFDNDRDPYQMDNLVGRREHAELAAELDSHLQQRLDDVGDEFLSGMDYVERWGYEVDERGTVPYSG